MGRGWTLCQKEFSVAPLNYPIRWRSVMAHKKIERKKELDRRRQRRAERLKQRVREAKAAKA